MSHSNTGDTNDEVFTLPLVKNGPPHGPQLSSAHGHGGHGGHGHGGADHVPHVLPLPIYLATWGALLGLTVVTVGASYFNFGSWNLIIALLIATTKASVVAALFMHLRYDRKFHTIIFSFSLLFLGIFIVFTMYDTETRGRTDIVEGDRPVNVETPFKGGKDAVALKKKMELEVEQMKHDPSATDKVPPAKPAVAGDHH